MPNRDLEKMRKDYTLRKLERSQLDQNPIEQFKIWFDDARASQVHEPNAMALATVDQNRPSCRIVLLKGIDDGFVFYTNYNSRKGHQLAANDFAAATFWWDKLERQVRIEGQVEKVDQKTSDDYFSSRPQGSKVSAAASPQSEVVDSYQMLIDLKDKIDMGNLSRPNNWGGYRLKPIRIEFWQGRTNRLHDRFVYTMGTESDCWDLDRLAP